jgi:hypothetical protein
MAKKKKRYVPKVKAVTKVKRHSSSTKKINNKYSGPTPRQNMAVSIARRNKAEDERNGIKNRRRRVVRMY